MSYGGLNRKQNSYSLWMSPHSIEENKVVKRTEWFIVRPERVVFVGGVLSCDSGVCWAGLVCWYRAESNPVSNWACLVQLIQ